MKQRQIVWIVVVLGLVFLASYIYIYQFAPFSDDLNNLFIYAADPIATLCAAISIAAVLFSYRRDDKPYIIWFFFTLGLVVWVVAEALYAIISYQINTEPLPGWADVFWFTGYALISISLYYQYQLIRPSANSWWVVIAIWVGLLLLTPLILFVLRVELSFDNFITYLYPVVDFAICVVSFRLYMMFGGGKLSRPWIGLFLLGIADAIWAWYIANGAESNIYADATYVAAYLILALGFFRQFLLLRFGPE